MDEENRECRLDQVGGMSISNVNAKEVYLTGLALLLLLLSHMAWPKGCTDV